MRRVLFQKNGKYLGREISILKFIGHGRRHFRTSGQGSDDKRSVNVLGVGPVRGVGSVLGGFVREALFQDH